MRTPAQLREASRAAVRAGKSEPAPALQRLMARHAFALAQLAEKIEREGGTPEEVAPQPASIPPVSPYRSLILRTISDRFRNLSVTWAAIAGSGRADE